MDYIFRRIKESGLTIDMIIVDEDTMRGLAYGHRELGLYVAGKIYLLDSHVNSGNDFAVAATVITTVYKNLRDKSIDYGFAHTIHKSQGGTYQTVFVQDKDISKAGNKVDGAWKANHDTQTRLRYVGVSRAENTSFVLSDSTKTITDPVMQKRQRDALDSSKPLISTGNESAVVTPIDTSEGNTIPRIQREVTGTEESSESTESSNDSANTGSQDTDGTSQTTGTDATTQAAPLGEINNPHSWIVDLINKVVKGIHTIQVK